MYNNQTTSLDDDGDIQAKKDLLQKEIIDRNFNKEQFIDFCSVKKTMEMIYLDGLSESLKK